MEKWHRQFDQLKKQWSNYNWIDNQYKPFSKQLVAKIGVAWVVKIPDEDFQEPVGWEVEIIDTPLGISERSHKLIKWLRNPPHFYDRLSAYNDSSDFMVEEPYWTRKDVTPNRNYATIPFNYWPKETFTIPPNEYEIFKKTCCQCKEKSFKNTSTNVDSGVSSPRLNIDQNIQPLIEQLSVDSRQNNNHVRNHKISEDQIVTSDKKMNTVAHQNIYKDIEKEIEDQIIRDSSQFSVSKSDQGYVNTNGHSKIDTSKIDPNNNRSSTLADKSIGTMRVSGNNKVNHHQRRSSRGNRMSSFENGVILTKESVDDWNTSKNSHKSGDQNEKTGLQNKLETSPRSHIPYTDDILTRGTSLEDYRDFENNIIKTLEETEYRRPNLNSTRNRSNHSANQKREQNLSKVNFNGSYNETHTPRMVDAAANITEEELNML
ncbi:hypothetical protein WA026_006335 [Henosepilachna vigintioctopunctata]|uniref:Uncharacterized protein n=1 Tax=Henosepilachna vigintioctopunctata TaxID=420089 RepID=A0AAW1TKA4_9CUCU